MSYRLLWLWRGGLQGFAGFFSKLEEFEMTLFAGLEGLVGLDVFGFWMCRVRGLVGGSGCLWPVFIVRNTQPNLSAFCLANCGFSGLQVPSSWGGKVQNISK